MNNFNKHLIERFLIEFNKNDRSGIYAFTQRSLAYNSNRIEGSTLTEKQTASLFNTGTVTGEDNIIIRSKDIEEMNGHFLMFNEMLKSFDNPLDQELIKRFHFCLKNGVFEDLANGYPVGEYKTRANIVSGIVTAKPSEVPDRMMDLLIWYKSSEKNLETLLQFHVCYERIHPFQDGNGRTGRMILFRECLKNDISPFIIPDNRKAEYYNFLNTSHETGDYSGFIDFTNQLQQEYFDIAAPFIFPELEAGELIEEDEELEL